MEEPMVVEVSRRADERTAEPPAGGRRICARTDSPDGIGTNELIGHREDSGTRQRVDLRALRSVHPFDACGVS
jgi:hypothetical protein